MFFEGAEKKVEIAVDPAFGSLRRFVDRWPEVVAKANAAILSTLRNDHCDAYLLSESSLFVMDRSLVMITCGATSLIDAVEEILGFVPLEAVRLLMYERKNEHNPDAQPSSFEDDVARLRGRVAGEVRRFGEETGNRVFLFHYSNAHQPPEQDMTLEILMHGLSARARKAFAMATFPRINREIGVDRLIDGFAVDDHLFDPIGYSLNAIRGREYYTIHVTPQEGCSYASFETNHVFNGDLQQTIERVLRVFRPQSAALVFFKKRGRELDFGRSPDYALDRQVEIASCGYDICFRNIRLAKPDDGADPDQP